MPTTTTNPRVEARYMRELPAGTVLFRQGESGQHMYVIRSGKVEITRLVSGREMRIAVLPPGEIVGEMSVINATPRSATARVIEDAQLVMIDATTLEGMIRQSSEIAVRLIRKLAARLSEADQQIGLLMLRDPSSRVVQCLRREAEAHGCPDAAGVLVPLDRAVLGDMLGLGAEEVEEVVGRLERAQVLQTRPDGSFVIAEVGKLQDFLDFLEMKDRYGRSPVG